MPWKNGGGLTVEWAVEPPEATLESGFQWRLSSAEVASSGPFSRFPGCDRWLLLLEGAGMVLDFGAQGQVALTEPLVPVRFSGDWAASATLVDGPCTDFNLMVDAQSWRAEVAVVPRRAPLVLDGLAETKLLFVVRGTAAVPALNLHLGARHLLRLDRAASPLAVCPGLAGAVLLRIDLHRTGEGGETKVAPF